MLSKEEYKRNLVRLWDSLRGDDKGDESCTGIRCIDCPFDGKTCNIGAPNFRAYEALEIVEKWAKEHPIVTNAEKFKEVFGVDAPMNRCIKNDEFCADCEYYEFGSERGGCKADERFWEAEYKEPAESEE